MALTPQEIATGVLNSDRTVADVQSIRAANLPFGVYESLLQQARRNEERSANNVTSSQIEADYGQQARPDVSGLANREAPSYAAPKRQNVRPQRTGVVGGGRLRTSGKSPAGTPNAQAKTTTTPAVNSNEETSNAPVSYDTSHMQAPDAVTQAYGGRRNFEDNASNGYENFNKRNVDAIKEVYDSKSVPAERILDFFYEKPLTKGEVISIATGLTGKIPDVDILKILDSELTKNAFAETRGEAAQAPAAQAPQTPAAQTPAAKTPAAAQTPTAAAQAPAVPMLVGSNNMVEQIKSMYSRGMSPKEIRNTLFGDRPITNDEIRTLVPNLYGAVPDQDVLKILFAELN